MPERCDQETGCTIRSHWEARGTDYEQYFVHTAPTPPRHHSTEGAQPVWEYEYADDDDPEGHVYGRVRRIVGPWHRDPSSGSTDSGGDS